MSSDFVTVTRSLVKRGWTDFEPKVISGLLTGSIAAFIISILPQFGVHLTEIQANYVVVALYFLGSYLTPSSGATIITHGNDKNIVTEKHSGPVVSTVTAPTAIQRVTPVTVEPVEVEAAPAVEPGKYDAFLAGLKSSHTDDQATQVYGS